jgi:TOTE conflict system, Archaeo-Eukaryotic Primase domain/Family of unknown function (DUF5906)/Primase C terminal 2 (PriCT-2)
MNEADKRFNELVQFVFEIANMARTDSYSEFNGREDKGYRLARKSFNEDTIRKHLKGTQPIGVYPVIDDSVRLAVLDFDNHDGLMPWNDMADRVLPLQLDLVSKGCHPIAFRSGGGSGIHIWLFWSKPQKAASVRNFLRNLLGRHDLMEGAKGLSDGYVEIFPKQDRVSHGKFGNLIALPLSRKSAPLDKSLQPIHMESFRPPRLSNCLCENAPDVSGSKQSQPGPANKPNADDTATLNEILEGDQEEASTAIKYISADDYPIWIKMALILKRSFGEDGFSIWLDWSKTCELKFEGRAACRRIWERLIPDGNIGLGSLFYQAKQKGWNGPTDPVIREMNARFGICTHKNKTLIIIKDRDFDSGEVINWLDKATFKDRLASELMSVSTGSGSSKQTPKSDFWMKHPKASHYHKIDFDPSKPPGDNGVMWNTWTGFSVEPKAGGSWDLLKEHILENICQGDHQLYKWVVNWLALGVQHPAELIGTAPVLVGRPGTGKSFLVKAYGHLWKPHFATITHPEHVTGRFNSFLIGRRLIFIDEGTFGGDRSKAGVLKTRITEETIMFEAKGVDTIPMKNRSLFIISSNEASAVPVDMRDRRWQVLAVGDQNIEDHGYFGKIQAQLDDQGFEAMLYELQHHDVTKGPDPRRTIKTKALFHQMEQSWTADVGYLHHILDSGLLPQSGEVGNNQGMSTIKAMFEDMRRTQAKSSYLAMNTFGKTITRIIPGVEKTNKGKFVAIYSTTGKEITERSTRYRFPPLAECRTAFEDHIGVEVPWSDDVVDWVMPEVDDEAL